MLTENHLFCFNWKKVCNFVSTDGNAPTFCNCRLSLSPLRLQTAPPDVDECETGVCAEECLNTPGSFRCFCDGRQGMKLSQDLRSCKVKYTNSKTILKPGAGGIGARRRMIISLFQNSFQPLTPCMSPSLKKNSRSLYLGRMFSGVPMVRLRFRRKIPTG